jgi:hypothetical protein
MAPGRLTLASNDRGTGWHPASLPTYPSLSSKETPMFRCTGCGNRFDREDLLQWPTGEMCCFHCDWSAYEMWAEVGALMGSWSTQMTLFILGD